MEIDYKKTFWSDAAKAGSVLGGFIALVGVLFWVLKIDGTNVFNSLLTYGSIVGCVFYFGRKRAALYGDEGFSYGQSLSFIIASMLFAGVIVGVVTFLLHRVIDAEYYQGVRDLAMINSGIDIDSAEYEISMSIVDKMMNNPIIMVFSGMVGMIINGLFVGLIASVFIKKQPNIFADEK